jgi:histidinol-phosphate aminotransferase
MTMPGLPATRIPSTPYNRPAPVAPDSLRLDGNEGSRPDPELLRDLAGQPADLLRDYPDLTALVERIAQRHAIEPARVVVTDGADGAMDRLFRAFLAPGRELLVPVPTFEMIHRFAAGCGAEVVQLPWVAGFPLAAITDRIGPRTALVAVVSPNNPTGAVVSAAELAELAGRAAAASALLMLDHVYAEYADHDLTAEALAHPNVVVLRTFSKAWGLAGCRVGYALAAPEVAATLRNAGNPYPVAAPSARIARRRLDGGGEAMARHVARVRRERRQLSDWLADRGVEVPPSQGNFVLADFGRRAGFVRRGLAALGVLVRAFPHRPEIADALRISLPGQAEGFDRLLRALATVLKPQALLFDLDGVLADVESSYRRSILATVASFGVELSRDELRAATLAGNANNDWELSRRLLAERGVAASLGEVTRRFQGLYLGSEDVPGLRERERPLVTVEQLAVWADRLPLAVVTGRPRAEAEWFLGRHGLTAHVATLVAQEDAPAKPDPAPVRLALERLGVTRAWMVGDTPDDVTAAARAGVLPLGVPAPGEAGPETAAALTGAGAAVVLETTTDLEELL